MPTDLHTYIGSQSTQEFNFVNALLLALSRVMSKKTCFDGSNLGIIEFRFNHTLTLLDFELMASASQDCGNYELKIEIQS